MLEAIEALPDKEKLMISLYYYEELTMKEIGQIMGYTESRISQSHTQAMYRLKHKLRGIRSRCLDPVSRLTYFRGAPVPVLPGIF